MPESSSQDGDSTGNLDDEKQWRGLFFLEGIAAMLRSCETLAEVLEVQGSRAERPGEEPHANLIRSLCA